MRNETSLEALLKRDRIILVSALAGISALAWLYMFSLARGMNMDGGLEMAAPRMQPWGGTDLVLTFLMWAVMMVAMMVPSSAPMVLMFSAVHRKRSDRHGVLAPVGAFFLGYLVVWTSFSVLATATQWQLHSAALLSPEMRSTSAFLGGALLVAAGVYQWTPLKQVCLTHCRSPLGFLMTQWREGKRGAFVMGLRHGSYCVGCCWFLMALLFVAGVMNLLWVATIAAFVLAEKVSGSNLRISHAGGLLLIAWGSWLGAGAVL